jgi:serine/threonine protein kinase
LRPINLADEIIKTNMSGPIRRDSAITSSGPCASNSKLTTLSGSYFMLDRRFVVQEILGRGALGTLVSARDTITEERVAVKRIDRGFDCFTKRTLHELKIMRLLQNHENVLGYSRLSLLPLTFGRIWERGEIEGGLKEEDIEDWEEKS